MMGKFNLELNEERKEGHSYMRQRIEALNNTACAGRVRSTMWPEHRSVKRGKGEE